MAERSVERRGDPGCEHDMRLDREYDLPDPDPRNPVHVLRCTWCDREVHEATYGRFFGNSRQLRSAAEPANRDGGLLAALGLR